MSTTITLGVADNDTGIYSGSFTTPAGVFSLLVRCWGAGDHGADNGGVGGGSGQYAEKTIATTPGTVYLFNVDTGGGEGGTEWSDNLGDVIFGANSAQGQFAITDTDGTPDLINQGANGGSGATNNGGGGASSGYPTAAGTVGGNATVSLGGLGAAGGALQGAGGDGGQLGAAPAADGMAPGGGGGGGRTGTGHIGGSGADGQIIVEYTTSSFNAGFCTTQQNNLGLGIL